MKITIPVNEDKTTICPSFGRTPMFLIYDTETKNQVFLDNSAAASQGGAGIKAAQSIVDNKVEAVLTPRCGENAANVLKAGNINIYKTTFNTTKENMDAFNENKLQILDDVHPGFHNHGGM